MSFHYSLSTWAVPGYGSIKFVCLQLAGPGLSYDVNEAVIPANGILLEL